ncbi:ATP-binding protein, partial [Sulfurimonas sp.]|nr:ATP-binding protein [Sulfurimonas sp.]
MKIKKLKVSLKEKNLVDISFTIDRSLALVGQSGSGKSLTLKALLAMLPDSMQCELDHDASFNLIAGDTVAFVPQNPFTALSPL